MRSSPRGYRSYDLHDLVHGRNVSIRGNVPYHSTQCRQVLGHHAHLLGEVARYGKLILELLGRATPHSRLDRNREACANLYSRLTPLGATMRLASFSFVLVFTGSAFGQSSLPPCPEIGVKHNCFGKSVLQGGATYVGDYQDNKRSGQGTYTWPDGTRYVGEWRDDKRSGQGTWTHQGGEKYVGEWRDDKPNGLGARSFPNGATYVGYERDGLKHGPGTWTHPSGWKYVGEFRDDGRGGQGVRYSANGAVLEAGRWENDRLVQSLALDTARFPFDADKAERERATQLAAAVEAERRKQEEIRIAAAVKEERKKRPELEERLAAAEARERERIQAQAQSAPQPQRPQAAIRPERRVALVIGNSNYKVGRLDNPVNDATDMATALRGLGFEVTLLRDATLPQMRASTRAFEEAAAAADVVLIFYAGHGIEARGRNYMIPVNADIKREYELDDQAYNAGQWLDMLDGAKGRNPQRVNIVILDACRDNSLTRSWRSSAKGLGRMDAPSGTILVYSTAPGKVAADGVAGQRNSPFTKHLLQSLQTPNVPIELVLRETRRRVVAETKGEQVPWEHSSLIGEFVFRVQAASRAQ